MKRRIVDTKRKRKPTIIEQIMDSPGYPDLKPATVKVGFALLSNMPEDDPVVKFSQRELLGITGYRDFEPIKTAIEELQSIGILAIQKHGSKRTTFRATPLDPAFRRWLETGIRSDPAHGNPVQNTGTVEVAFKGSGGSVSDEKLENRIMTIHRLADGEGRSLLTPADCISTNATIITASRWTSSMPPWLTRRHPRSNPASPRRPRIPKLDPHRYAPTPARGCVCTYPPDVVNRLTWRVRGALRSDA